MKRLVKICLVVAVFVLGTPAQGAELRDLVLGKLYPLVIQLKDLDEGWMHVTVSGPVESSPLAMFAMLRNPASDVYYTKGETVAVGGEMFVIAYRPQVEAVGLAEMMKSEEPPSPQAITADSELTLSLLNLRAISSLNDIRPFDLEKELAEFERVAGQMGQFFPSQAQGSSDQNLKQMALALMMYAQDYDDALPPMEDPAAVQDALAPYVKSHAVFFVPSTGEPYWPNASLSGKSLGELDNPSDIVTLYERTPSAEGWRWVAFADGHVAHVEEQAWEALKEESGIP